MQIWRALLQLIYLTVEERKTKHTVKKLKKAQELLKAHGFTNVIITQVAGTDYIIHPNGTRYRIGRAEPIEAPEPSKIITPKQKKITVPH